MIVFNDIFNLIKMFSIYFISFNIFFFYLILFRGNQDMSFNFFLLMKFIEEIKGNVFFFGGFGFQIVKQFNDYFISIFGVFNFV